jgi:hypothetical protein
MIIHDGKKLSLEVNIGGVSQSQLEKILGEHSKMILDGLDKKIGEMPKQTYDNNRIAENKEEKEIESNSLDKIANIMSTVVDKNKSNFDNKIGNIKKTKRDVSKEIDILKNLE